MADRLDRGDLGALADPSWEEKWAAWTPERVHEHIAQAALYGPLSAPQVKALLQGLPPPPKGADSTGTVLAEFEAIVMRFDKDVERHKVSPCPTPEELAAWTNAMDHDLPEPFMSALEGANLAGAMQRTGHAPGGLSISLPAWIPLTHSTNAPVAAPRKAGRPRTAAADQQALVRAARQVLNGAAATGQEMTLLEVAKRLVGEPVAGAKSASTIKRQLNGQLDVAKAKTKARRVASTGKK